MPRLPLCFLFVFALFFSIIAVSNGTAQWSSSPLIRQPIDNAVRVTLQGSVHPLALPRFDRGAVPDSFAADRMLLLLKRSSAREMALLQFMRDAHTPGHPNYHKWLTPDQFGKLYGPDDRDIATVTAWLESQGFSVSGVTRGKTAIEFSGTAATVRSALNTEIHAYTINGEQHYANNRDLQIPAALAPAVAAISPLNDFLPKPYTQVLGQASYDPATHALWPSWTFNTYPLLMLTPGDFAVQYDLNPVYKSGIDGKGVTIGIIGASNVDTSVVDTYRTFFGLAPNPLKVVVDGRDPGLNYAAVESYLDVELAGAVAPAATIALYTAANTSVQSGLALAALRAVDDDEAAVLSTSYGACEQNLGSANQFWAALWQQAAAQGQTSFVSSGDGGPAGCDNFNAPLPAQFGPAVNGLSSTPWNVSVGGTDFLYQSYTGTTAAQDAELATYWDLTPVILPAIQLLKPVPEQPWNRLFGLDLYDNGIFNPN